MLAGRSIGGYLSIAGGGRRRLQCWRQLARSRLISMPQTGGTTWFSFLDCSCCLSACCNADRRQLPWGRNRNQQRDALSELERELRDCPDCPEMVVVPAGTFMMGSASSPSGKRRPTRRRACGFIAHYLPRYPNADRQRRINRGRSRDRKRAPARLYPPAADVLRGRDGSHRPRFENGGSRG